MIIISYKLYDSNFMIHSNFIQNAFIQTSFIQTSFVPNAFIQNSAGKGELIVLLNGNQIYSWYPKLCES